MSSGVLPLRLPAEQWRRNLYALTAASFMAALGFVFVMPLLPLLMAEMLGGDTTAAAAWSGLAFGISPLAAAVLAPFWGWMGDRMGHRMMVLRALIVIGLLMGLMSVVRSPEHLVWLRAALGALGAFFPAAMAAVATTAPRDEVGRSIGLLQASQVSGMVVGPLMGGVLADALGIRAPFVFVTLLYGVASVIVFWLYRDAPREARPTEVKEGERGRTSALAAVWLLCLSLFAAQFADSVFGPLLPLYMQELGVPAATVATLAGLTMSLGAVGAAVTSYGAPRLRRSWTAPIVAVGLAAAAIISLPVALASVWWQLLPLRTALGLCLGAIAALSYAVAAQRATAGRQGVIMGVLTSAAMLGWAAGALTTGALAGVGLRVVFYVNAGLFAAVSLAWWLSGGLGQLRRETAPPSGPRPEPPEPASL